MLTCSNGSWANSPTSFSYQWLRNGAAITGAVSNTYVLVTADVSQSIVCAVTATNGAGSTTANSGAAVPIDLAPANTLAPAVTGAAIVGSVLSCTQGTWVNNPLSYAYQWKRDGAAISGATSNSYTLVSADNGHVIICAVTATNTGGSATANSNPMTPGSSVPANTVLPQFTDVDGNAVTAPLEGMDLFLDPGTWSNSPTSYTWQVYTSEGPITSASGTYVAGEPIYTVMPEDVGLTLHVGVTAVNGTGSSPEVPSTATSAVGVPSFGAITLARTSSSGASLLYTMAIPSGASSGPNWSIELERYDPTTGRSVITYSKQITQDELTGPSYNSYWDGTYSPLPAPYAFDVSTLASTDLIRARIVYSQFGHEIIGDWSNWITPTDLTFGSELITNGSFSVGTGWTLIGSTISGGVLNIPNNGNFAYQSIPLQAGHTYRCTLDYNKTGNDGAALRANLSATNGADVRFTSDPIDNGAGTLMFNFTSDVTATVPFQIEAAITQYSGTLDNISVREIIGSAVLGTLSLSSTSFTTGTPASGTIIGATSGSTIAGTSLPTGFTINSAARTFAYDGTGTAGSGTLTLTETLSGAVGSPKTTNIGWTYASGSAWTPASLGSTRLKLWLKGDDLTGSNGSDVNTWADASGNSNDATGTGTTTSKPTLVTSGLNSKNTVGLVANSSAAFTLGNVLSGATAAAGYTVRKLSNDPPSNANWTGPSLGDFGTEASANHEPYTDGTYYDDFASTTRQSVTGFPASSGFRIIGRRSQANDWRMNIDGAASGTGYYSTATNTVGINTAPQIGAATSGASTYNMDGEIAEIVVVKDFLTDAEAQKIEGYLAWKWGLQANLPSGHPYKSAAP